MRSEHRGIDQGKRALVGLRLENIEAGARPDGRTSELDQCAFVDQVAARRVDQNRAFSHQPELAGRRAGRFPRRSAARSRPTLFSSSSRGTSGTSASVRCGSQAMIFAPRRANDARDPAPDAPVADKSKRAGAQQAAGQRLPSAAADRAVRLGDAAKHGKDQPDGQFRHRGRGRIGRASRHGCHAFRPRRHPRSPCPCRNARAP